MLNISLVILMRTDSNLCRKELTVHWSAPNSLSGLISSLVQNSMWGDESEAVAPIIWLYQIVDAQKEEVFFPDLLMTLQSYVKLNDMLMIIIASDKLISKHDFSFVLSSSYRYGFTAVTWIVIC